MIQRPITCQGCLLHELAAPGFCPDLIPDDSEIIFVAEAPGEKERIRGEPLIGQAGWVLENWLVRAVPKLRVLWDKKKVGKSNVLRCLPPKVNGRPYPTGAVKASAETTCRQYDIAWPQTTHTVVLLGENSQRLFFGEELAAEDASDKSLGRSVKGVMGRIGREIEKDGIRYVFGPHPAFIMRQPALVTHGQRALEIAAQTSQLEEPEYIGWENALRELNSSL